MKLAETYGSVLTGRAVAAAIAEEAVREVARGGSVVLDFQGIEAVSPSFADELFGKLRNRAGGEQVRFLHLSSHLAAVARMAEQHRRLGS